MSNNTITIIGRVGQAPKKLILQDTANTVVKFSVAVKNYSAKSEQEQNEPTWFDVDAWNGLGDLVMELVTKGREVKIDGKMVLSTYKKEVNGIMIDWPKAHIKMTSVHVCGKRPKADGSDENGGLEHEGNGASENKTMLVTV